MVRLLPDGIGDVEIGRESIGETADKNDGREVVELLLGRHAVHVTEGAVVATAMAFGAETSRLLLKRKRGVQPSKEVVKATAGRRGGSDVMQVPMGRDV